MIDWTNQDSRITPSFTVGDACMLHSWNRLANEQDGLTEDIKTNLVSLCNKMEEVASILGYPLNVHCMYRSPDYNQQILHIKPSDPHSKGFACDFDAHEYLTIDEIHEKLEPELERLNIRMERNTPSWCHIDMMPVGHNRYFYP